MPGSGPQGEAQGGFVFFAECSWLHPEATRRRDRGARRRDPRTSLGGRAWGGEGSGQISRQSQNSQKPNAKYL